MNQSFATRWGAFLGRHYALLLLAAFLAIGAAFIQPNRLETAPADNHAHDGDDRPVRWTCSMCPQFVLPEPGKCPKCFMDLIPLVEGADAGNALELVMTPETLRLADIRTTTATRGKIARTLILSGRFDPAAGTFTAAVSRADVPLLASGDKATLEFFEKPGETFAASLAELVPAAGVQPTRALFRFDAPPAGVARGRALLALPLAADGTRANASPDASEESAGEAGEEEEYLLIPRSALLWGGNRAFVFVASERDGNSVFTLRETTPGATNGQQVAILDGLSEGEAVAATNIFRIDSSMQMLGKISLMNLPEGSLEAAIVKPSPYHPEERQNSDPRSSGLAMDDWFAAYEDLRAALAKDDDAAARQPAERLATLLATLDAAPGPQEFAPFWNDLRSGTKNAAAAGNLRDRRKAFDTVSDLFVQLAARYGAPKGGLRLIFCPMAFNNRGAFWLQPAPTVDNPYHGLEMPRCGWEEAIIPAFGEKTPVAASAAIATETAAPTAAATAAPTTMPTTAPLSETEPASESKDVSP